MLHAMVDHPTSFKLDDEILDGLKTVTERDGIPRSEQVRRALRAWLQDKGVLAPPGVKKTASTKTARKRAGTRKRA
jgi:hypothetical protein